MGLPHSPCVGYGLGYWYDIIGLGLNMPYTAERYIALAAATYLSGRMPLSTYQRSINWARAQLDTWNRNHDHDEI